MTMSSEMQEIRRLLPVISPKLDLIVEARDGAALAVLSEASLNDFLEGEPDIYYIKDVKVRYS